VLTQFMMAMPLLALYEISIIGARIFGKKRDAAEDEGLDDAESDAG
jgi:sec-independent protein translocase protein TatC